MERIGTRLRSAREREGYLTAEEFADYARIDPAIYRGYETGARDLSPQTGHRIAELLNVDWVDLMYGQEYVHAAPPIGWRGASLRRQRGSRETAYIGTAAGSRPLTPAPPPESAIAMESAAPYIVEPRPAAPGIPAAAPAPMPREIGAEMIVDELDSRLAGGAGLARAGQHPVHEWLLPRDVVRLGSKAGSASLKMIAVAGDDMEPTFRFSDRVLIDISDMRPSPPGIFVVWDGMSLILRRIEIVPGEPTLLRIAADNPKYQPIERRLAETVIQGRVLAKWSWV